jgi:hypothetical protein
MAAQSQPDPGCATGIPHSLRVETAVLPFEYPDEFHQLKQQLEAEFKPVGARESLLFDEIIMAAWCLRRLRIYDVAMNAQLFRIARTDSPDPSCMERLGAMLVEDGQGKRLLGYLARIENAQRRAFHNAVRELERLQAIRRTPAPPAQQATPEPPAAKLASVVQNAASSAAAPRAQRDSDTAKLALVAQNAAAATPAITVCTRQSPPNDRRAWRL